MIKKTHLYSVIGVAAFVIGGIVTREKALEMTEIMENFITKKKPATPPAE